MMRGHLGQYVIVQPDDQMIIVRLGNLSLKVDDSVDAFNADIYAYIDEAYAMMK